MNRYNMEQRILNDTTEKKLIKSTEHIFCRRAAGDIQPTYGTITTWFRQLQIPTTNSVWLLYPTQAIGDLFYKSYPNEKSQGIECRILILCNRQRRVWFRSWLGRLRVSVISGNGNNLFGLWNISVINSGRVMYLRFVIPPLSL